MLRTLVVGFGRAGAGLHVPVLRRAHSLAASCFAEAPIIAVDPASRHGGEPALPGDVTVVPTLTEARALLDPAASVVHVCTPPVSRAERVEELAELGFRNLIVEKPLAVDTVALAALDALRARHGLRLVVVAQWLASTLTARLRDLIDSGELGALRSITFAQHKPRFRTSLATSGHPTAFDVELPHALGVALALAGPAHVVDASDSDLRVGTTVVPRLGSARLRLAHDTGVRSDLVSDLSSPIRERRLTLGFERGSATGHFPVARDDDHARLTVRAPTYCATEVFPDDSLTAFVCETYRRFLEVKDSLREFDLTSDAESGVAPSRASSTITTSTLDQTTSDQSTSLSNARGENPAGRDSGMSSNTSTDSSRFDTDLALARDVVRLLHEGKHRAAAQRARVPRATPPLAMPASAATLPATSSAASRATTPTPVVPAPSAPADAAAADRVRPDAR